MQLTSEGAIVGAYHSFLEGANYWPLFLVTTWACLIGRLGYLGFLLGPVWLPRTTRAAWAEAAAVVAAVDQHSDYEPWEV